MRNVRGDRQDDREVGDEGGGGAGVPGKTSLTSQLRRGPSADDIADRVVQRLARGSGSPLDSGLRGRFEGSLGADLGGVRVHTDGDAADTARDAGARAFAVGQDVFFGADQYRPETTEGQFLIAHEVAHTVQQQGAVAPQFKLETTQAGDACEDEADSLASAMVAGAPAGPVTRSPVQRISRTPTTTTEPPAARDVILEQIAHRLAYQPRLSEQDVADLRGWGYEVALHQVGLRGDLDLFGVRPIVSRGDVTPVLAFRGTLEGPDFIDDANPEGIGMYQFSANEAVIRTALGELGAGTTVTGHSLGGALAQICAAMYPGMVAHVVTFQSPGIRPDLVERMLRSREGSAIDSHHHRVTGDFVEHAGAEYTPGDISVRTASPLQTPLHHPDLPLHQGFPLAEQADDAGTLPPGVRFPTSGDRVDFESTTIEGSTDDIVSDLEVPRAMAGSLVAGEEGAYVRVWMQIRAEAEAGMTRWSIMQARIDHAEVSDANKAALRENLSELFPEIAACGELEAGAVDGTGHASRVGFIHAVEARVGGLDDAQRTRVGNYYDHAVLAAMTAEEDISGRMSATGGASGHHRPMRKASRPGGLPADAHEIAARGAAGGGGALPHGDAIQAAFGHHDVGGVSAHMGSEASAASEAIGARAYAYGNDVVFDGAPDLHTAAHEAAHVVQQRAGVHLAGGVGEVGDTHERHADAVADRVVRGESAEALLDEYAPTGGTPAIQRDPDTVRNPGGVGSIGGAEVGLEGHIELHQFRLVPEGTQVPVGPYVFFTGLAIDGMLDYRAGPSPTASTGTGTPPPPSTEVHVGPGGARGHGGGHGHAAGVELEVAHHLADLFGHGTLDVTGGGEVSTREASIGVGITGGNMRFGDFVLPLPSVELNFAQIEWGERPRFMVANLTVPFTPSYAFHLPITALGGEVQLVPHADLVFEFEPNIPAILGTGAVETAATVGAGDTAAVLAAESGVGGTSAILPAIGLAATIGAPLVAGAALLAIFAHETGEMEELVERSRTSGHAVFNYCMAYTMSWFGDSVMTGVGAAQGAAHGVRDVSDWRTAHPGATRTTDSPASIYQRIYDLMSVVAETSLRESVGAAPDTLDDLVIRDAIGSVRWGGPRFLDYGSAPIR